MTALLIIAILISGFLFFRTYPDFGKVDEMVGKKLPADFKYYYDGKFHNILPTPMKPEDVTYFKMFNKMSEGNAKSRPNFVLPFDTPDLSQSQELKITWFGHSTYMLQLEGKNILVDPVFSSRTSPFSFLGTKQFAGTNFYNPLSFPEIDLLLITHDHYDHLDYQTILKIKSKVKQVVCPVGVAKHFEFWGFNLQHISEMYWGEEIKVFDDWKLSCCPSRHFSGRLLSRNVSMWASYVLNSDQNKLFLGGDSGYGTHFKEIGNQYGPFDLAILECGQYNEMWPNIHLFPEQVLKAAKDLQAQKLLPVHWGKYKLALHDWNEPIIRLETAWSNGDPELLKPQLGQSFYLNTEFPESHWALPDQA